MAAPLATSLARTIPRPIAVKVIHNSRQLVPDFKFSTNIRFTQTNSATSKKYSSTSRRELYPSGIKFPSLAASSTSSRSAVVSPSHHNNQDFEQEDELDESEEKQFEEEMFRRQYDLLERGFYVLTCSKSQQSFKGGQNACTAIGVSMSRKFLTRAESFSEFWFENQAIFQKIIKKGVKWQRLWASKKAVDVNTKPSAYSLCEIEPISKKVKVNSAVCYGGSCLDEPDWGSSITDALQLIFNSDNATKVGAFLLTVAEYTTFVGKNDTSILWFDSHLRDQNGLQDGNGSAVWMQFYDWRNLRDHIIRLYGRHKNAHWEIVGINKL